MDNLNNSKQVKEQKSSCGGCLILLVSAFILWGLIALLFAETPEEAEARRIKEAKEEAVDWANMERWKISSKGAETFLRPGEFDCFMKLEEAWIPWDHEKLIRLFQEGTIDEEKFRHEIKQHLDKTFKKIYHECRIVR